VSLIKKSDVKNHLSPRYRTQIHLCEPESEPDATGFSAEESGAVEADASDPAKDLNAEHSSSSSTLEQGTALTGAIGARALAASKSVKA
jgi:hypothetical protein